jgi:hypothetical protein
MADIVIPLRTDILAYALKVTLDNVVYTLRFRWNSRLAKWIMDISDVSENPLLMGLVLYEGIPLIWRFVGRIEGLPPGGFLVVDETGQNRDPDVETLGTDVKLIYTEAA